MPLPPLNTVREMKFLEEKIMLVCGHKQKPQRLTRDVRFGKNETPCRQLKTAINLISLFSILLR